MTRTLTFSDLLQGIAGLMILAAAIMGFLDLIDEGPEWFDGWALTLFLLGLAIIAFTLLWRLVGALLIGLLVLLLILDAADIMANWFIWPDNGPVEQIAQEFTCEIEEGFHELVDTYNEEFGGDISINDEGVIGDITDETTCAVVQDRFSRLETPTEEDEPFVDEEEVVEDEPVVEEDEPFVDEQVDDEIVEDEPVDDEEVTEEDLLIDEILPFYYEGEAYGSCEDLVNALGGIEELTGGDADDWDEPLWELGAWVYTSDNPEELNYPGFGHFDYYQNYGVNEDVEGKDVVSFLCFPEHEPLIETK